MMVDGGQLHIEAKPHKVSAKSATITEGEEHEHVFLQERRDTTLHAKSRSVPLPPPVAGMLGEDVQPVATISTSSSQQAKGKNKRGGAGTGTAVTASTTTGGYCGSIKTVYQNGVLKITFPKTWEGSSTSKKIKII